MDEGLEDEDVLGEDVPYDDEVVVVLTLDTNHENFLCGDYENVVDDDDDVLVVVVVVFVAVDIVVSVTYPR